MPVAGPYDYLSTSAVAPRKVVEYIGDDDKPPPLPVKNLLIDYCTNGPTKFKMTLQYDKADAVQDGLRTKFDVYIDDDRVLEC